MLLKARARRLVLGCRPHGGGGGRGIDVQPLDEAGELWGAKPHPRLEGSMGDVPVGPAPGPNARTADWW
jgi:hypothetical protein